MGLGTPLLAPYPARQHMHVRLLQLVTTSITRSSLPCPKHASAIASVYEGTYSVLPTHGPKLVTWP